MSKNSEVKKIIAENISYYLEKNNINSVQLASDLGLKYTTVRNWLQEKNYPRIDKIEAMADYFDINKALLVEKRGDKRFSNELNLLIDEATYWFDQPITSEDKQAIKRRIALYFNRKSEHFHTQY